jgi:hypothetical protein
LGHSWRANNISHSHQLRLAVTINKLPKRSTVISPDVLSQEISTVGYFLVTAYKLLERCGYFLAKAYKLLERSGYFLAKVYKLLERSGYFLAKAYKLLERSGYFLAKSVQVTGARWLLSRKKLTIYWRAVATSWQ